MTLCHGDELHAGICTLYVGPRGGRKETIERWRVSGACKTWVRNLERFRVPIKYGMYQSYYLTEENAHKLHLADDCPLLGSENMRLVRKMVRETRATVETLKREGEELE